MMTRATKPATTELAQMHFRRRLKLETFDTMPPDSDISMFML